MYVVKHISLLALATRNWKTPLLLLCIIAAVTTLYLEWLHQYLAVSMTVVSGFSTAISLFIAFFINQAYDRWWEARKIWGSFVNDSRSFGRMVKTFPGRMENGSSAAGLQQRLIRRHIAFLYAVKERLRQETTGDYAAYLSDMDANRVKGSSSVGNALLELQSEELNSPECVELFDVIRVAQFNEMLNRFSTEMGMAERIKTTVFPAHYAAMIRTSLWVFALVFPLALSEQVGYWAILYSSLLVMIFTKVFELGLELLNPFEGQPSDIPVSSIIRTIEINLLEQMGKKNLPPPLDPVDGRYLM